MLFSYLQPTSFPQAFLWYNSCMTIVNILGVIALFVFGSILGSFACCQAWRIRLKETRKKSPGRWSVCMSCGKRLTTTENIPVISWIIQKGKCKKCGAKIGLAEILSELSLGATFVLLGLFLYPKIIQNPMNILAAIILAIALVVMWILMVYDAKWQKLPTFLLTIMNICAIIYIILQVVGQSFGCLDVSNVPNYLCNLIASAAVLAGPYFLLSFISREKLVGAGDWLVALPVGLMLGHWWLALVALFVANFTGSVYGIYQKIRYKKPKFPFAPFLIIAFVVVYYLQDFLTMLMV